MMVRYPYCVLLLKKKVLFKLSLSECCKKGNVDLNQVLHAIESKANRLKIDKVQLSLNDNIFTEFSVIDFKNKARNELKRMKIALTPSVTYVSDREYVLKLLQKYHDDPMHGGHAGVKRLYKKLRLNYFWPGMLTDISNFVKSCEFCQTNKTMPGNKEKMSMTPTPQRAFDMVLVDTIGPLPKSNNGNTYAVTLICDLTKYLVTIPLPDKRAVVIAKAMVDNFILTYGPMKQLLSDRGSEYVNSIIDDLCKLLNIENKTSTPYHHRTLGTVERSHRTFNEYLRSYVNEYKTDWDDWLKYFTYCYNTTPSVAIADYSPYQLVFSKTPVVYDCLNSGKVDPVYNLDDYHKEVKFRLQTANQIARKFLEKSKLKRKTSYDIAAKPQDNIALDDLVLIRKNNRHKLDPLFKGPFKVKEIINPNIRIEDDKGKERLIHKDDVKRFDKCFYFRYVGK